MLRIITVKYGEKIPTGYLKVDCTSKGDEFKGLSPFSFHNVNYFDIQAKNVENSWQYSKVYKEHDTNGQPNANWYKWRQRGFESEYAHRYPMGKGVKPLYSYFNDKKYSYVEARKELYFPLYIDFCLQNEVYFKLKDLFDSGKSIAIVDFDVYLLHNKSLIDAVNDPNKKAGHGFVLYHLLTGLPYK